MAIYSFFCLVFIDRNFCLNHTLFTVNAELLLKKNYPIFIEPRTNYVQTQTRGKQVDD